MPEISGIHKHVWRIVIFSRTLDKQGRFDIGWKSDLEGLPHFGIGVILMYLNRDEKILNARLQLNMSVTTRAKSLAACLKIQYGKLSTPGADFLRFLSIDFTKPMLSSR